MGDTEDIVSTNDGVEETEGLLETSEQNDLLDENEGSAAGTDDLSMDDDADLEAIKARVKEMEEEAEKIRQMQSEVEKQMNMSGSSGSPLNLSMEEKMEVDARSIYVGNVDYGATAEELENHFHGCGSINRVTILCDKFTGQPKGFAYIEFTEKESVQTAMALDESLFRGRQIKVNPKRTNRPGMSGGRGRGRGRGRVMIKYVYAPFPPRGRGRGMYSRRRNFYAPY